MSTEAIGKLGTKDGLRYIYLDILPMDLWAGEEIDALWVLSTGRCGTVTLSQLLEQSPDMVCFHEPMPRLMTHFNDAYHNPNDEFLEKLVHASRIDLMSSIKGLGYMYGEASNRTTPYAPYLKRLFPKSKFIWLMRDMDGFVPSAYHWRWYDLQADKYRDTRLIPPPEAGTRRQVLAWYWCYVNEFISKFVAGIDRKDWMFLDFDAIQRWDMDTLNGVFDWVGIKRPELDKAAEILEGELNHGRRHAIEKDWGIYDRAAQDIYASVRDEKQRVRELHEPGHDVHADQAFDRSDADHDIQPVQVEGA